MNYYEYYDCEVGADKYEEYLKLLAEINKKKL